MLCIYALTCPDTGEIRYIGKSIRPKERLANHMNEVSNCHRSNWLQSLKKQGKRAGLTILQVLADDEPWQEWEKSWIRYGREVGWRLTNNTEGGDGVCGLPAETRARMAKVWLGRKHKPETIAKLVAARAKRTTSDETRAKHSASMKGRKITWGDAISQGTRKLSDEDVKSIKASLLAGVKGKDLAMKYGVDRTTISKVKLGKYPK